MTPRKRVRDETETTQPTQERDLLQQLRNMWEFSCVMQFMFTFGKVVKLDDQFDIEDFEMECLNPQPSNKLEEIGLTLLKWISSHRGLTSENWDEYTRRQYLAKAPHLNPYGSEEEPRKFQDFDISLKIRVLHQMTIWTFWNPDRIRERMPEQKEMDQTLWRVEELGWDRKERSYFVLDDSRLYRRTEPPLPPAPKAKPKSNTLKAQAERRRASKRRRLTASGASDGKDDDESMLDESGMSEELRNSVRGTDTFGGFKWECIAVTSQQYHDFLATISNSRDANEKELCQRLVEQVLPVVDKSEESQRRKTERKQKELLNAQKLTSAKRSSRLADKFERERQEREAAETAGKHAAELAAAHKEQERQTKLDEERKSRMMTREQRIKDREYKRLLHEEELANVTGEARRVEAGEARGSERHLKAQIERHRRDLEDLSAAADWVFDCSGCGVYGKNVDDGAHSVACESCNVWQHSKCLDIRQIDAEQNDFHFVCKDCRQRIEDAKRPNIKLKFRASLSTSPPQVKEKQSAQRPSSASSPVIRNGAQRLHGTVSSAVTNGQATSPDSKDDALFQPAYDNHQLSAHQADPSQHHARESWPSPDSRSPSKLLQQRTPYNPDENSTAPAQGRLPSPVLNRPSMSPTQGNPDVGPLAGVPQHTSLSASIPPPLAPPFRPARLQQAQNLADNSSNFVNGVAVNYSHLATHVSPHTAINPTPGPNPSVSQIQIRPQPKPLSGLSPTKHSPPSSPSYPPAPRATASADPSTYLVPPSSPPPNAAATTTTITTPSLSSAGTGPHASTATGRVARSVSGGGTPTVFPLTEKETLRPSPDQVSANPMPTPSKSMTPGK